METKMHSLNSCLYCGSEEQEIMYKFDKLPKFKRFGKEKDIVKCCKCDLIYCSPREQLESMLEIYENNYWHDFQITVGEKKIEERHQEFEMISVERIEYIQKFRNTGKFLDVGCSLGYLVNAAKNKGFDAYGIDLNQKDLSFGSEKYSVNLKKSLIKDYDSWDFDVIASFNVIEHVSYPNKMLFEMKKRIKQDGLVVIGTHDIECKNHLQEKENWKHIIPNEHMYFFSIKSLNNLAQDVGLKLIHAYKPIENGFIGYFKNA